MLELKVFLCEGPGLSAIGACASAVGRKLTEMLGNSLSIGFGVHSFKAPDSSKKICSKIVARRNNQVLSLLRCRVRCGKKRCLFIAIV